MYVFVQGNVWNDLAIMTEGRSNFGMSFDPIRGLIIVGGLTSIGSTRSTEIFKNGKFVKGPDLRHRLTNVEVFSRHGDIFTVGGLLNGDPSKVLHYLITYCITYLIRL